MKKYLSVIFVMFLLASCMDDADEVISSKLKLEGAYFEHTYDNCSNDGNLEFSCTQWVKFHENNKAEVLIGGNDIVWQATYSISDKEVYLIYENESLNEDADGFRIANADTLVRFVYDEVWVRKEMN
ncbi:hypothetical protein [Marivirga atlantica]|jgi:hypothetical protein|uniref:Lipocalin-like domain-containing protein n=1 Tax=Marivirga atlantica TaxID=1548457 RepID=A0A937DI60_9BACT|nr:hypothetical protein [Marivirga atlantica]MBL0766653.1 hypothetical protein [Marivirga atlantica]